MEGLDRERGDGWHCDYSNLAVTKYNECLVAMAQWVLANYVQRGPGSAAGRPGGGPAGVFAEPVRTPHGVQIPRPPVPGQAIPVPQMPLPESPMGLE